MIINQKEMNEAITQPMGKSGRKPTRFRDTIRYDVNGKSDQSVQVKLTDDKTAGIIIPSTSGTVFKVRVQRNGQFFNPLQHTNLNDKDKTTNDLRFKFKAVSEQSFMNYIKFLETRYDSYIVKAEREA